MKRYLVLGLILGLSLNTHAAPFSIPSEYSLGTNVQGNGFYILEFSKGTTGKDIAVFMHGGTNERPKDDEIWITICFESLTKGLKDFKCTIEQKDFYVDIRRNEKIAVFNKKEISPKNIHEINYKIDNSPIATEKYQLLTPYKTDSLLRQLSNAKKLSYSWKGPKGYISQDINMKGFNESFKFAKRMIEVNE